jgi:hypothetical protein
MNLWTTFCPSKICWELTYIESKGKKPTSEWLKYKPLIEESLKLLKKYGIDGIRLVIFPGEVTTDGKRFDWTAIETMLNVCRKQHILVDLCLGPYQYPYYPGIYLPPQLLQYIYDNDNALDTNPELRKYGIYSLQAQLEKYGEDKRIAGFHLANEWPDRQNISGKEKLKKAISEDFMIRAAALIKASTDKPIRLNTNVNASDKKRITNIFTNMITILGSQGYLGFDIYPSQETWKKQPLQKLRRLFENYSFTFRQVKKSLKGCTLYFAEVEAQPWGNGRAWHDIIKSEVNPQEKVLQYSSTSLEKTWDTYIKRTNCNIVSLWGSDFWLAANKLGITWPLKAVKIISSQAV